jgi:hypothetical protein
VCRCLEELPRLRADNDLAHRAYLRQYSQRDIDNGGDDLKGTLSFPFPLHPPRNEGGSGEENHSRDDPWEDPFPVPPEEELPQWSATRLAAFLAQVTVDGDRDPIVRHVMETEITRIWRNLQWQPGYVMSDEDFKVFTFFQYSYPNHPIAIEAIRKYRNRTNGWEDTLSEVPRLVEAADSPKTINKTAYSKEHSRPDRRTQDVGNSLENPLKGNRKHDREDSDTEDAPEVPTDTPEAATDFEESPEQPPPHHTLRQHGSQHRPRDGWEERDSCKSPAERPHVGPSWANPLKEKRLDPNTLRLRLSPSGNNIRQNTKPGTRRPAVGNGSADRFKENIKPAPTHAVASHGCPHPRSSTQRTTRGPVAPCVQNRSEPRSQSRALPQLLSRTYSGNGGVDPLKENRRPDTERPTTSRDPARQRLSKLDGRRVSPRGRTTPHDDSNCPGAKVLALRGISRSVANKSQAFPGTTPRPEEQSFVEGDSDNNDVDHLC